MHSCQDVRLHGYQKRDKTQHANFLLRVPDKSLPEHNGPGAVDENIQWQRHLQHHPSAAGQNTLILKISSNE